MPARRVLSRLAFGGLLIALPLCVLFGASASASLVKQLPAGQPLAKVASNSTVPSVGPLFPSGLASKHTCTAAVIASPAGNVIVTAAHCVAGTATGTVFAPGYDDGVAPYGTWIVQRSYVDPSWVAAGDDHADVAFLVVSPSKSNHTDASIQSVVGGNALGGTPTPSQQVLVVGYVSGRDDDPVVCSAAVYFTQGFPSFDCGGYAGGTSGGPWIADYDSSSGTGTIEGVIGGLNQGGCETETSYSSPLGPSAAATLARASSGAKPDVVPAAGPDGC